MQQKSGHPGTQAGHAEPVRHAARAISRSACPARSLLTPPFTRSSASTSSTPRYFWSEWRAASFLPRICGAGWVNSLGPVWALVGERGERGGIRGRMGMGGVWCAGG